MRKIHRIYWVSHTYREVDILGEATVLILILLPTLTKECDVTTSRQQLCVARR